MSKTNCVINGKFTCVVNKCDRKLDNLTSLNAHVRSKHINMKGYICTFTECPRKSAGNQYKCHQGKEIWNKEDIEVHELPLNQKNLKFATVKYLCPLGYDKWCNSSNKKFENAEYVKKHLLNFHKIPRKLQKPRFAPIPRITYKS